MMSLKPETYADYACSVYLESTWSAHGVFDDFSQTWLIVPLNETYEVAASGFLAVGRSGADGIDFGYRKSDGLWAFYPVEKEYKFMAESIRALVDGWCSGHLSV